ncbi:MAG TPA: MATE family efflux transporter, partial [Firmicutes bacterium]|nr:MATE family efflux transporter [Bacillota bacterium]
LVLNAAAFLGLDGIIFLLQVPESVVPYMRDYLFVIFMGIGATFLYNYFACLLRAVGNSAVPLLFLGVSALLNVGLDLLFILAFSWGVAGAAIATVIAQFVSGIGLAAYTLLAFPALRPARRHIRWDRALFREIAGYSFLTCVQQSIMNFGILLVQGRVNSFGPTVMAAFAAAVKIDSFAYMPVQDFGNAFSTFVAQNYGAGQPERIRRGARSAGGMALLFCLAVSAVVCLFARPLMTIFISPEETAVIEEGVRYLWVEGSCYVGIGLLFLLYGFYRAVKRPGMSVVLTVLSLGTRVILAYALSAIPAVGVVGIWVSVPIGWLLADAAGIGYYLLRRGRLLPPKSEEAGAA